MPHSSSVSASQGCCQCWSNMGLYVSVQKNTVERGVSQSLLDSTTSVIWCWWWLNSICIKAHSIASYHPQSRIHAGLLDWNTFPGILWWFSGLRIWRCHCCGSNYCCGTGLIPGLGTSTYCGCSHKKKKKLRKKKKELSSSNYIPLPLNNLLLTPASMKLSWVFQAKFIFLISGCLLVLKFFCNILCLCILVQYLVFAVR